MDQIDDVKTTLTVLRTDGSIEHYSFMWPAEPGYERINEMVRPILAHDRPGAEMEHVGILGDDGTPADLFVDDEGWLHDLPRNEAATTLYRRAALALDPSLDPEQLHAICGTCCVFSRKVWA